MENCPKISASQLGIALAISRLFAIFSYKPVTYSLGALDTFIGVIVSVIINALIFIPFLFIKSENRENKSIIYRALFVFAFAISAFCCIECISQFDFFMASTIYLGTSPIVFIVPMLLIAVFICSKGVETIVRISGFVFGGLVFSIVSISISVIPQINHAFIDFNLFENTSELLRYITDNVVHTVEILPFVLIYKNVKEKAGKTVLLFSIITLGIFSVSTFFSQAVLGDYKNQIMFPFYTISAMAKSSVTDRFSAAFLTLWVFVSIIRLCLYLICCGYCLTYVMPKIKLKLSYVISSFVIGIGSIIATGNIVHIDEMYKFYLTYVPIAFATAFSLIVARIKKGMS